MWNELDKKSHLKIFNKVGAIGFGLKENAPFIDEAIASGRDYDLDVNYFTGAELRHHYPGLSIPDDFHGFFEPHSGFLFSENCIRAYRELATHFGAHISFNNPVKNIKAHTDNVEVRTVKETFTADKLIISAGAWTNDLTTKLHLKLPLVPTRQPVAWFEADESLFNMDTFPVFMVELPDNEQNAIYYGFPSVNNSGLKIGRHDFEDTVNPDTMSRKFGYQKNDETHLRIFLNKYMPKASGKLNKGIVCIYTRTPDGHFIIDNHPAHEHIFIAAGFSGHGFKFASVIGEIMSQLVMTGKTDHDISLFKINRPSLEIKD